MLTKKQHSLLVFLRMKLAENGICPSFEEMRLALGLKSKSGIHRMIQSLEERGFIRRLQHRARALEILRQPEETAKGTDRGSNNLAAPHNLEKPNHLGLSENLGPPNNPEAPNNLEKPNHLGAPDFRPPSSIPARIARHRDRAVASIHPKKVEGIGRFSGPNASPFIPHAAHAGSDESVSVPLYGKIAAGTPIAALRDETERLALPAAMLGRGDYYALRISGDSMINAGIFDGDMAVIRYCRQVDNNAIVVALIDQEEATLKRYKRKGKTIALEAANPDYETRIFGEERIRIQGQLALLLRHYH